MGDFIAQCDNLGDILDVWAIKIAKKNIRKAQIFLFLGNIFSSAYVVKYVFG